MAASYTVTISSLNSSSKGRYRVFFVTNMGQALGIVRMCLKTWGGFADIIGENAKGEFIKKFFVFRAEGIIEIDEKSSKVLWDMAWNFEDEDLAFYKDRHAVTHNIFNITVEDTNKRGLISRVLQKIRDLL